MTPADLALRIVALAKSLGWETTTAGEFRSAHPDLPAGFPNVVMCKDGQTITATLVPDGSWCSDLEGQWIDALGQRGADAFPWRPADLADGTVEWVLQGEPS
jgi:hypothetical protein